MEIKNRTYNGENQEHEVASVVLGQALTNNKDGEFKGTKTFTNSRGTKYQVFITKPFDYFGIQKEAQVQVWENAGTFESGDSIKASVRLAENKNGEQALFGSIWLDGSNNVCTKDELATIKANKAAMKAQAAKATAPADADGV